MKNLKEFEKYLEKDYHPDAWADCYSDFAQLILKKFSDEERYDRKLCLRT